MTITTITVHAAAGFNHPHESYSNFKPAISLTATLAEGEDATRAACALQATALALVLGEKKKILDEIDDEHDREEASRSALCALEAAKHWAKVLAADVASGTGEYEQQQREAITDKLAQIAKLREDYPTAGIPAPPTADELIASFAAQPEPSAL